MYKDPSILMHITMVYPLVINVFQELAFHLSVRKTMVSLSNNWTADTIQDVNALKR